MLCGMTSNYIACHQYQASHLLQILSLEKPTLFRIRVIESVITYAKKLIIEFLNLFVENGRLAWLQQKHQNENLSIFVLPRYN